MIFSHDFSRYTYLFKFRNFQDCNLSDDIKDAFLSKLNVSNPQGVPSFENFWTWVQSNYGDDLAKQFSEEMFQDIKQAHRHLFMMIDNYQHSDWNHIKSYAYSKWCSVVTQAQCTYAVLRGIDKLEKKWSVLSSAKLDSSGIDLAILTQDKAIPIKIKKNTNCAFVKDNQLENGNRVKLFPTTQNIFAKSLSRFSQEPQDMMILKYGFANPETKKLPYDYLVQGKNNFVYFDGERTVNHLEKELM